MKILPAMSINKKCFTAISVFWHPNVNEVPKMEHSVCDPTDAATHPLGAEWGGWGVLLVGRRVADARSSYLPFLKVIEETGLAEFSEPRGWHFPIHSTLCI